MRPQFIEKSHIFLNLRKKERKRIGQIHIYEVSLRGERLRRRKNFGSRGTNTYLWSLTSKTKRDFGDRKTSEAEGQIHFCEVSLRGRRETSRAEGQIHICEVSLRRRRETSETEKLRKQRGK